MVKNPPANAGDTRNVGLIPGLRRALGEENGNPLQYLCLGNPIDRVAQWAAVHSPWCQESDTTEHRHATMTFCILNINALVLHVGDTFSHSVTSP